MDENEFRQLLELFPVVRSRDFHADVDPLKQLTSQDTGGETSGSSNPEAFWGKLKLSAELRMAPADAARFCKAFQQVYKKLVYEELTMESARSFMESRSP